ncbi:hypothetical protein BTHE_1964 [Bifidobacterium thermophilum]|nr:hypothetical protein BTHE_1964 [Bifidobacterium thermophilum]
MSRAPSRCDFPWLVPMLRVSVMRGRAGREAVLALACADVRNGFWRVLRVTRIACGGVVALVDGCRVSGVRGDASLQLRCSLESVNLLF